MADLLRDLQAPFGGENRFEKELSGGGMSRVYITEQVGLGRGVVIKVRPSRTSTKRAPCWPA